MVESALALQTVIQKARGHGPRLDRLSHVVYHVVRDRLDAFEFRLQQTEGRVHKVVTEADRRLHDMCTSIGQFIDEQRHIRRIVEEPARRVDATQNGTLPAVVHLAPTP